MKKLYAILSAGVMALMAVSCVQEQLAVYDETKITAPVLGTYNVAEDVITANYTPAKMELGFNENIAPSHTLAVVSLNGEPQSKSLTTTNDGATLTLKTVNLAKALITLGAKEGSNANVELAVRATLQDVAKDNGVNGYKDSEKHIVISGFAVVIPEQVGSPYEEYTEASPWSLIGAMAAYEINWDGDLNMWATADGKQHVAAHVTLKAGDEVKFRKDQDWAENFGGDFATVGDEFAVTADGPNIKITKDGVYDLFLDTAASTAIVAEAYDPYPDFTQATNWTVIGALSKAGINWDGDIEMLSDGTVSAAFSVALAAEDEFKFRQDKAWTVNLGGDFGGMDTDFAVTADGPNIKVGTEGVYDLFVDPSANTAKVTAAAGVKVSSKIGADTPPEPEPVTGWNIIGLNGDWENDVRATENEGVWTAYITATEATAFKWRKDGGWDENYGIAKDATYTLGTPFAAVAGGENIPVETGFYKAELNLSDAANPTITISNGEVWSLIGAFNEWAGDVDMTLTDGKWVSPATKLDGEFKIRKNHDWTESVGGTFVKVGEPFAAGTENIKVPAGTYVVTYDPTAATILVEELGWGLVGTINGWGGTPDIILKEEGLFLVARNVTLTADDAIKIRYNQDWADNRGGKSVVGVPVQAVSGGDDIKPGAGTFDVYYRPDCEVIIVNVAGEALTYWGVVGTINGWAAPDKILFQNADGLLESAEIELTATDEIKIRKNEDWGENRGGTFVNLGEAFAVENNGANIALGREAKVTLVYDAANETITIKGEFIGDAPAFPDDIYAIGGDTGWSSCYQLHGKNGQYKGFGYLSQEFKFKPNAESWDGDWECVGEGQIGQGNNNCPAPATAGYYMIEVDLNEMTYKLTLISGIGIIGPAQAGGWDSDTDLTYNATSGAWEAEGITLSAGEMKFRANDGWDINWGGALDALVQGGDNIAVQAGTYNVQLFALCDTKAYATLTAAAAPADWKGDATDISTAGTANCYIVSAAGAYKIPAVKGNSNTSVGTVASAAVVWETYNNTEEVTVNSVIAAVDYDETHVYFKTPDTLKPGNALVAAKDASGKIIWSWHIWIPKTAITNASYDDLFGSNAMSRNLGALEDAAETGASAESCGLLYQWGRKDPFMGVGEMKANSGTAAKTTGSFSKVGEQQTIAASIENPTVFTYNGETAVDPDWAGKSWSSEDISEAWGTAGAKGLYDPCPAGYKVPAFDETKPGWIADGWTLVLASFYYKKGGAVFPYAGYLDDCGGSLSHGGDRSAVWSATESDADRGKSFDVRSSYSLKSQYKSRGNSVRCVAE